MRKKTESHKLEALAIESMNTEGIVSWKNSIGEIFEFEAGELVAYTDTRVIHHEDDGLCNLMEHPLVFDNEDQLDEMDYANNI